MKNLSSFVKSPLQIIGLVAAVAALAVIFLLVSQNTGLKRKVAGMSKEIETLDRNVGSLEAQNSELSDQLTKIRGEKHALEEKLQSLEKVNESLETEFKKAETTLNGLQDEKTYLEEILIRKTKEIEKVKELYGAGAPSSEELKKLQEENRLLKQRLENLVPQNNTAKPAAVKNAVDLGSITVNQPMINKPKSKPISVKEGRVLAVNEEHGFVIIDLGKADGVKPDSRFSLKKKDGHTAGTLDVVEIRDTMTACNVKDLKKDEKVEISDPVSLER